MFGVRTPYARGSTSFVTSMQKIRCDPLRKVQRVRNFAASTNATILARVWFSHPSVILLGPKSAVQWAQRTKSHLKKQNKKSLRDIQWCRYCYCLLACIWFCAEVVSFDTTRVRARFSARSRSFSVLYFCNSYSRDAP